MEVASVVQCKAWPPRDPSTRRPRSPLGCLQRIRDVATSFDCRPSHPGPVLSSSAGGRRQKWDELASANFTFGGRPVSCTPLFLVWWQGVVEMTGVKRIMFVKRIGSVIDCNSYPFGTPPTQFELRTSDLAVLHLFLRLCFPGSWTRCTELDFCRNWFSDSPNR
jgi:hypothetical protein